VSSTAASGQVAKRLTLLGSVLAELTQGGEDDPGLGFKDALLEEMEGSMANPARQVGGVIEAAGFGNKGALFLGSRFLKLRVHLVQQIWSRDLVSWGAAVLSRGLWFEAA
jgi:hypothetical protein